MNYFLRSVRYALNGIYKFFRTERNGKIQGVISLLVIIAAFVFNISGLEWILLLFCIATVISLEMLNSAIEGVCNLYTTEFHPGIERIKDIAAAAVLWSAFASMVVGLIIFVPHLLRVLQ
jgi:diacylglycerol kinase